MKDSEEPRSRALSRSRPGRHPAALPPSEQQSASAAEPQPTHEWVSYAVVSTVSSPFRQAPHPLKRKLGSKLLAPGGFFFAAGFVGFPGPPRTLRNPGERSLFVGARRPLNLSRRNGAMGSDHVREAHSPSQIRSSLSVLRISCSLTETAMRIKLVLAQPSSRP